MLAGRLQVFLEVLSGEDIRYHTPFLRGVFISSTHQQESRQSLLRRRVGIASPAATAAGPPGPHCFLRDLFESIMPRDRGLSSAIRSSAA